MLKFFDKVFERVCLTVGILIHCCSTEVFNLGFAVFNPGTLTGVPLEITICLIQARKYFLCICICIYLYNRKPEYIT
ncbi:hypothetical protein NPIL_109501 [Nephila pilipes]|uniref:Uncharacterized protein n=1 Tax=Nephila pilipes TaxID=299642 RepID=A0A8X6TDG2_NEPPI|nr:hypothetical protein NPIL_109501 [Nephila pilipes]